MGLCGVVSCRTESTTYSNEMSPSDNDEDEFASISQNCSNSFGCVSSSSSSSSFSSLSSSSYTFNIDRSE